MLRKAAAPLPTVAHTCRSLLTVGILASLVSVAHLSPTFAQWTKLADDQIGPRQSPALFWSPERKSFVLLGGIVSHMEKGDQPYDAMTLDVAARQWKNDLPPGAATRGSEVGTVKNPGFKSPWYELGDLDGVVRPHNYHALLGNQAAFAPWDGKVYALVCGRTLRYDPVARTWEDRDPPRGPAPLSRHFQESLNWGSLCADPVNREIVLCGGGGVPVAGGSPGTWVYSTENNTWTRLPLRVQPRPRALSPMVFDPVSQKILLFGGDGLDQLFADTWLYDPATRAWRECKPSLGPSPRFGHALVYLTKSRKLALLGGNGYTSGVDYQAMLYRRLPWEVWTYDVAANAWQLIQHNDDPAPQPSGSKTQTKTQTQTIPPNVPQPNPVRELAAAANDRDEVLVVTTRRGRDIAPATWICNLDLTAPGRPPLDPAAAQRLGVKPDTVEYRTGPYDPAWYTEDVPPVDAEKTAAFLADLPANRWTALECPKWPHNRMGGGWSTVAFDSDNDQILHLGGGHSSYFGNDVAHYAIATGRWNISYRPQFALNYNYDLSGPGPWAFNDAPWGGHNYRAYAYDASLRRLVYLRGPDHTLYYDPETRRWSYDERRKTQWPVSKYTSVICSAPQLGTYAWVQNPNQWKMGVFKLEPKGDWSERTVSGDPLPHTVVDGSTLTCDSKRSQLIMTTSSDTEPLGQVWTYDLKTGTVKKLNPKGMKSIPGKRFAREAVLLPKDDLLVMGYKFEGKVPVYDLAKNQWFTAELPGSDFITRTEPGASVDLGLAYDAKRNLVWAVMCQLKPGALQVLRIDRATLNLKPLE